MHAALRLHNDECDEHQVCLCKSEHTHRERETEAGRERGREGGKLSLSSTGMNPATHTKPAAARRERQAGKCGTIYKRSRTSLFLQGGCLDAQKF